MFAPRVYLVTDRRLAPDLAGAVAAALDGLPPRTVAVQLREKGLRARDLLALARELVPVCRARGQLLLVNERLDVALAAGADGVHLPSDAVPVADARRLLGATRVVGVSCHRAEEVARARDGGADFATFGPVYDTPSKRPYGAPVGVEAFAAAARLGLPLVALGGVAPERVPELIAAGASGVAAIRAWLDVPDRGAAVRALLRACEVSAA